MTLPRREFLHQSVAAALALALDRRRLRATARLAYGRETPDYHALAMRALDAARTAGARFADVRFTFTRVRTFPPISLESPAFEEREELGIGVRALADGGWGFGCTPFWTPDDVARAGRQAAELARSAGVAGRDPALARPQTAHTGSWTTPIAIDPFEVSIDEVYDWLEGFRFYAVECGATGADWTLELTCQSRVYASTDGAFVTQTVYTTDGGFSLTLRDWTSGRMVSVSSEAVMAANRGWEHIRDAPIREEIPRLLAEMRADLALPVQPVDVGRYDIAFDAHHMAMLLGETIGYTTQLDRALGEEANAGGTSYITDPDHMVGSYVLGSPLLTVSGDRTTPGALATVQWDAAGTVAQRFGIIARGVLADLQAPRHGCLSAPSALEMPLQHTPNLSMLPGATDAVFDDLVSSLDRGLAAKRAEPRGAIMDQQHLSGLVRPGTVYKVERGKRTAIVAGAGLLFRAPDLWKSLIATGGPSSQRWLPVGESIKGEPAQRMRYSIGAVPGVVKQITTIDIARRA